MSDIVLQGVSKRYGAVRAVDAVSVRADAGKFLVARAVRSTPSGHS